MLRSDVIQVTGGQSEDIHFSLTIKTSNRPSQLYQCLLHSLTSSKYISILRFRRCSIKMGESIRPTYVAYKTDSRFNGPRLFPAQQTWTVEALQLLTPGYRHSKYARACWKQIRWGREKGLRKLHIYTDIVLLLRLTYFDLRWPGFFLQGPRFFDLLSAPVNAVTSGAGLVLEFGNWSEALFREAVVSMRAQSFSQGAGLPSTFGGGWGYSPQLLSKGSWRLHELLRRTPKRKAKACYGPTV